MSKNNLFGRFPRIINFKIMPLLIASLLLLNASNAVGQQEWGDNGTYPQKPIYKPDNAPKTPLLSALERKDRVSQYGITWIFSEAVPVGQFITGDWYVVGPVTIKEISPKPLFGNQVKEPRIKANDKQIVDESPYIPDQLARNGSELNPIANDTAGFDSRIVNGRYDPNKFVKTFPFDMKPGDALLSTISKSTEQLEAEESTKQQNPYDSHVRVLSDMAVLTCVENPLPPDAFRPGYLDRSQKIYYSRNLHRELLHDLPLIASAPDIKEWTGKFRRPWITYVQWGYANPHTNQPEYDQWTQWGSSRVALMLHMQYDAIDKEQLLIGYIQFGIDLYSTIKAGYTSWTGQGGYNGGRKWPILFTGIMLGEEEIQNVKKNYPNTPLGSEETQVSWGINWEGEKVLFESHPRWRPDPIEQYHPSTWVNAIKSRNGSQSMGYRMCCTSNTWPGQALAVMLMGALDIYDYDPFFAYVDRWMKEDLEKYTTLLQQIAADNALDWTVPDWWKRKPKTVQPFETDMWKLYRNSLPAIKTPDNLPPPKDGYPPDTNIDTNDDNIENDNPAISLPANNQNSNNGNSINSSCNNNGNINNATLFVWLSIIAGWLLIRYRRLLRLSNLINCLNKHI